MRDLIHERLPWFACLALAFAFGCQPRTVVDVDSGPDPDEPQIISCEDASDCPNETFDCVGVCLKRCGNDAVCDEVSRDYFCSDQGYCEPGCRTSDDCDDPENELCSDGVCRSRDGAGACATKCDCTPGEVCNGGVCTEPPGTCANSEDCGRGPGDRCEAFLCNGFTQQCFDPDPQPCNNNEDCDARPGCQDGCVCTPNSQCVPQGACTVETEDVDCGAGFYCTDDLVCDVLPACTEDAQCEPEGLTCNEGQGSCERPRPCVDDNECTPPRSYCNTTEAPSFCDVPTCLNGGFACGQGQTCSVDGRCVTEGTGDPCAGNAECPADQFCSFATGEGICTPGCRSNASCPSGQVCNGANECVSSGGNSGNVGDTCTSDEDCDAGLVCGVFTSVCTETCNNPGGQCNGGQDCCPLSGSDTCEDHPLGFGFIGYCPLQ